MKTQTNNQSFAALTKAIEIIGSQAKLARLLGKKQPHIFKWLHSPVGVPAEHCPAIERLTDHAVTCEQLRPDVDWAVLRQAAPVTSHPMRRRTDHVKRRVTDKQG